jgi:hypothetical protein
MAHNMHSNRNKRKRNSESSSEAPIRVENEHLKQQLQAQQEYISALENQNSQQQEYISVLMTKIMALSDTSQILEPQHQVKELEQKRDKADQLLQGGIVKLREEVFGRCTAQQKLIEELTEENQLLKNLIATLEEKKHFYEKEITEVREKLREEIQQELRGKIEPKLRKELETKIRREILNSIYSSHGKEEEDIVTERETLTHRPEYISQQPQIKTTITPNFFESPTPTQNWPEIRSMPTNKTPYPIGLNCGSDSINLTFTPASRDNDPATTSLHNKTNLPPTAALQSPRGQTYQGPGRWCG